MNLEKVNRVIELQNRINLMIEKYGEADVETVNIMMELIDGLTPEEDNKVIELSYQLNF